MARDKVNAQGFGLIELLVVLVIAGLLLTLAVPAYNGYTERARVARAIGEIGAIGLAIDRYRLHNDDQLPMALNQLQYDVTNDPWGRPYVYLNILAAGPGNDGLRKDGKLNPLNTDFDLFSMGRDGASAGPLSAKKSKDDVVRANNGAFIGLGKDY